MVVIGDGSLHEALGQIVQKSGYVLHDESIKSGFAVRSPKLVLRLSHGERLEFGNAFGFTDVELLILTVALEHIAAVKPKLCK